MRISPGRRGAHEAAGPHLHPPRSSTPAVSADAGSVRSVDDPATEAATDAATDPGTGAAALERLSRGDRDAAGAELAACLDAPAWVEAVLAERPYSSAEALLEAADRAAAALTSEQVLAALRAHPRIGERPSGEGAAARSSRREQAAVATDADTAAALLAGNAAYEERFGHVFLVRAAGRSAPEVLEQLEQRLGNDPAAEVAVAGAELREIALLRLRALLDGPAAGGAG